METALQNSPVTEAEIREAMKLALAIARKRFPNRAEEIAADCSRSIVRAIDSYDRSRGVPFDHYCLSWIKRDVRRAGSAIILPFKINHTLTDFPEKVRDFFTEKVEFEESYLGEVSPEFKENLEPALNILNDRERNLIIAHFIKGETLLESGRRVGISQQWCSRIVKGALGKMKTFLENPTAPVTVTTKRRSNSFTFTESDLVHLTPDQQTVIRLVYIEYKSLKEAAFIQGIRVKVLRNLIYRARKTLQASKRRMERRETVIRLFRQERLSAKQISKALDLSETYVYSALKYANK